MRLAQAIGLLATTAALAACSAPARIGHHRMHLVEVPAGPLTPEGRPSPVPPAAAAAVASEEEPARAVEESVRASDSVAAEQLVATARGLLGKKHIVVDGKRYPSDCTGLVRAVYAANGVDLFADGGEGNDNGVTTIWRYAARHGDVRNREPRPGDLVFFRETYDRNRDGRSNDGLTHVGIVESVEPAGTVNVIHRVDRGVVSYRMNVDMPGARKDANGRVVNDYLRAGKRKRLAGELFAGFATLAH